MHCEPSVFVKKEIKEGQSFTPDVVCPGRWVVVVGTTN